MSSSSLGEMVRPGGRLVVGVPVLRHPCTMPTSRLAVDAKRRCSWRRGRVGGRSWPGRRRIPAATRTPGQGWLARVPGQPA